MKPEIEKFIKELDKIHFTIRFNSLHTESIHIEGLNSALDKFKTIDKPCGIHTKDSFIESNYDIEFRKQLHNTEFTISSIWDLKFPKSLIIRNRPGINETLKRAIYIYSKGGAVHVSINHHPVFVLGDFYRRMQELLADIT